MYRETVVTYEKIESDILKSYNYVKPFRFKKEKELCSKQADIKVCKQSVLF